MAIFSVCRYFNFNFPGRSLKPLDIEVMKRLGSRVNLIPVIAKADTLTPADLSNFKRRVCIVFLFVCCFECVRRTVGNNDFQLLILTLACRFLRLSLLRTFVCTRAPLRAKTSRAPNVMSTLWYVTLPGLFAFSPSDPFLIKIPHHTGRHALRHYRLD